MTILAQDSLTGNQTKEIYVVPQDKKVTCFINVACSTSTGDVVVYLRKAGTSGGLQTQEIFLNTVFEEPGSFASVSILLEQGDSVWASQGNSDGILGIMVNGSEV
jgi:hypothetical protein